jgi:hypothetical protein
MPAAEKIAASVGLSLVGLFLFAWVAYVFALPRNALWLSSPFALAELMARRHAFARIWRDAGRVLCGCVTTHVAPVFRNRRIETQGRP